MDRVKILELLRLLGTRGSGGAKWVPCSCPLAPWTHDGGTDRHPSFGVSVGGIESVARCWSCGFTGSLYELCLTIRKKNIDIPVREYQWRRIFELIVNEEAEIGDVELPDYDTVIEKPGLLVYPEEFLAPFRSMYTHPYLLDRGVSSKACRVFDVRFDPSRLRVCFPVRDFFGRLVGMQGRSVDGSEPRYLSYTYGGKSNNSVWFGEAQVNLILPVVLVEGPIDLLKVYPVYPNVLAGMTSSVSESKLSRISDAWSVITLFDYGKGGDVGRKKVDRFFAKKGVVMHLVPSREQKDAGNMSEQDLTNLFRTDILGIDLIGD
jgi:hypothetical protein